jgi:hypothetical protein
LIWAAAMSGAAVGAGVDVLTAGISFGVFMAIGGAVGAVGAAVKGRDLLTGRRLLGMKLDKHQMQVGPVNNIQLLYILLDRALLYYSHVVSWAHGRRDHTAARNEETDKQGYASEWTTEEKKICDRFFRALQQDGLVAQEEAEEALAAMIQEKLEAMSNN